jgi:hypothetical protein
VTVTSFELTFEIDAPEIVRGRGDGDGLAWMTRFATPSLLPDESRAEENLIDRPA